MNIVIVGASRGIGSELSAWLTTEGHNVFRLSRSTGFDARNRRQISDLREKLAKDWTHIDALICCAARHGPIEKAMLSNGDWIQAVADNLACTLIPIQVFGRMLRLSHDPKVICFSGGGATKGRPMFSAYASSKCAVVRLVETIALEEPWLDINAVAPGAIETALTQEVLKHAQVPANELEEAHGAQKHREIRLQRLYALIQWLLSPEANGISGRLVSAQHDDWEALADQPNAGYLRRTELLR